MGLHTQGSIKCSLKFPGAEGLKIWERNSSGTYVFFHSVEDQRFELVEAIVDASPSAFLHDGLVTLQQSINTNVSQK